VRNKARVEKFLELYNNYDAAGDIVNEVLGFWYEGKLGQAASMLLEQHIDLLEKATGLTPDWLSYWLYENDQGAAGLEVTVGGETRALKTLDDLFWAAGAEI